jgi:hypothetical protein
VGPEPVHGACPAGLVQRPASRAPAVYVVMKHE